jgi:2-polyprenyl-3-methyl-5-hydroxy-6-metoxy-1,4-benzoquinol methylase
MIAKLAGEQMKEPAIIGTERGASYYDDTYSRNAKARLHYTQTEYYGLWATLIDRLRILPTRHILEIGCGAGQLANAIRDLDLAHSYLGIDFSKIAVRQAREVNPGWSFRCADVFADAALEDEPYDVVLSTEFFEHVNEDLAVVQRIRAGTMVLASVPNFPWHEHVRHFRNAQEVHDRYIPFFETLRVVPIRMQKKFATHFLLQGARRG